MIVIVFGLPGSGKSYFASRLAGMINAQHINSDIIRKTLFDTRTYSPAEKLAVYHEMLKQARAAERKHSSLVLDATFYKNDIRKLFIDGIENRRSLIFIEIRSAEPVTRERLKRPRKDSEADYEVYKKIKERWQPFTEKHLILQSTDDNINDMLTKTAEYLQRLQ